MAYGQLGPDGFRKVAPIVITKRPNERLETELDAR